MYKPTATYLRLIVIVSFLLLASCASHKKEVVVHEPKKEKPREKVEKNNDEDFIKKYSALLGVNLDGKTNKELIITVSEWLGVPYKYGGDTKSGTDCSGFVGQVFSKVYHVSTSRSASGLYEQAKKISRNELKDGDLVFFKINSSKVGHVGIYLKDGYFIHATTRRGVMVNNLSETYYSKYYFASGRILP